MADPVSPQTSLDALPPSALCSLGPRSGLMTGILLWWLRGHFFSAQTIEDPMLRSLLWTSDPTTSGLVVETSTRWVPKSTDQRPALVISRNELHPFSLGFGDDEEMGYLSPDGFRYFTGFSSGSHTVFAIATEPGACEHLAEETYRELRSFAPVMRPRLLLLRLKVAEKGKLHLLKEALGSYAVPITLAYSFQERWVIRQEVPILKQISLKMLTDTDCW